MSTIAHLDISYLEKRGGLCLGPILVEGLKVGPVGSETLAHAGVHGTEVGLVERLLKEQDDDALRAR